MQDRSTQEPVHVVFSRVQLGAFLRFGVEVEAGVPLQSCG
jgi:hypothetical protein